jgi:hypothetical protein
MRTRKRTHEKDIVYKIPKVKRFSMHKDARHPMDTYNDFWKTQPSLGKKRHFEPPEDLKPVGEDATLEGEAKPRHKDGYVTNRKARFKSKKITYYVEVRDKDGNVVYNDDGSVKKITRKVYGLKSRQPSDLKDGTIRAPESQEGYEKRLNFGYVKKKYYGRFTKNPRQPGRGLELAPQPPEEVENERQDSDVLIQHVRQILLKRG